jgi:hypothetical protein
MFKYEGPLDNTPPEVKWAVGGVVAGIIAGFVAGFLVCYLITAEFPQKALEPPRAAQETAPPAWAPLTPVLATNQPLPEVQVQLPSPGG